MRWTRLDFDAVGGSEGELVFGGHFAVGGGVFAGDEGEASADAEVDGDGAGAVFEAVEAGGGFAGFGFGAGALWAFWRLISARRAFF
jgi:hypothetical protein